MSADELTLTNTRVSGNTIISVDNLSGRIVKDGADDTEAATVGFRLNAEGTDYIKEIVDTSAQAFGTRDLHGIIKSGDTVISGEAIVYGIYEILL